MNDEPDMVNHPPHYTDGSIETIDYIESVLGGCFVEYCRGQAIKYLSRAGRKKGSSWPEDFRKAIWYLERAIR